MPSNLIKVAKDYDLNYHVSDHFIVDELICRCGCNQYVVNEQLLDSLEKLRAKACVELFNRLKCDPESISIHINSWCRCESHNEEIGGAKNSYHLISNGCLAVDLIIKNGKLIIEPKMYYWLAEQTLLFNGLGMYYNRIHVDVRPFEQYSRWIHRGNKDISLKDAQ